MKITVNRREALGVIAGASGVLTADKALAFADQAAVQKQHDQALQEALARQVTQNDSRWRGAYPNAYGLHNPGSAGHIIEYGTAAYLHPPSRFYQDAALVERITLAVNFLTRTQSPEGLNDLLTTNFDSPPDTAFVVEHVARAAKLARLHKAERIESLIKPYLISAGGGMARGGIHTPNHRWVVCAALAQIHELYPDEAYINRIDQWLAEGIDIDAEGQFIERSTSIYNAVSGTALLITALKLNRPELIEPVRKNLDAMRYLVHPNFEVVTEISRRQDLNTRATMQRYWFPLRYLAIHDQNGQYAALAKNLEPDHAKLPLFMEYETLRGELPESEPLPQNYKKHYSLAQITRIRRGPLSATIMHQHNPRWFSLRWGDCAVNAIRFASAFFGKGQFLPEKFEYRNGAYYFEQTLRGPYYQPIEEPALLPVTRENWGERRGQRVQSNVSEMRYTGKIVEKEEGFEITIEARGTENVPLVVEINLREGGALQGIQPAPLVDEAFLFEEEYITYQLNGRTLRIGPGINQHGYTQVRGADAKLPGPSVYLTDYTPFKHTLEIRLG